MSNTMSNTEIHGFDPNKFIPKTTNNNATDDNTTLPRKKKNNKYYKSSSRPGTAIIDAVTGQTYKYKVGSIDEKRFFTVMINEGKEGIKLFYSSPEQYESQRRVVLNDSIKIKWKQEEDERRFKEFNTKTGMIEETVPEDERDEPVVTIIK